MAAEKIDALELDITAQLSVENLDKLVDSLRKLGKEMDNVKNKNPKQSIKQTGDSANEAAKGFDNFLGKTVRVAAVIALFSKLTDTIGDCVSKSLTYQKTLNMFTVSLGEYADNATKYANAVNDALGIDIAGWQNAQGIFQTLITGFGVTGDKAAYMSQNLTQLTYDIASFYNLTNEEAANKIKSALSGRLEPIRKLGYDLSQSKLVDIAKNPKYYGQETFSINEQTGAIEQNTIATDENTQHKIVNFNQLTQQEKVQLRYIALMTEVTQVQGNYARALADPANQMRIFKEQTEMTSRALGNVFIPAINAVLPYLTALAQLAEEAFNSLASLFGYDVSSITSRIGDATIAEPYNDIVKATGAAANNAKKIRDYTIGLDELNVLREPTTGAGGGGSSGGQQSNLSNLLTPGYDFITNAVKSRIEEVKSDIKLLQKEFELHPITFPAKILMTGTAELGENFWTGLLGKTPDELGIEAALNGNTIGEQFCIAFYEQFSERSGSIFEMLFGSADELGKRAEEAGRDAGKQFALEFRLQMLEYWGDDPLIQALYGGESKIKKDKEKLQKAISGDYSGGGRGGLRVGSVNASTNGKSSAHSSSTGTNYAETLTISKSLGNTAADEARKAGEAQIKAYSKAISDGASDVQAASNKVFNAALNGSNNNGKGGQMFYNTSANEAYKYAMGLTSPKAKSDTNLGGKTLAAQGVNGAKSLGNDTKSGFPYAGSMAGQGYVGSINKYKSSASSAGRVVAEATLKTLKKVLGIASPSKVMAEQGMWTVLGYVEGIDKYASMAEQATKDMANASVKAISTTNEMMNYSGNVPTTTNVGYGIGMANQGSMATLASNIYNAIASGMAGLNAGGTGDIKVIIDGKEVFNVVQSESRKRGIAISNGAFSTI